MSPLQQSDEADHDALRKIRSTYEDALNNRDLEKIKPLLADGFTGVVVSGDEVRTFEDMQAFMNKVWEMTGVGGRHHVNVVADHTDLFRRPGRRARIQRRIVPYGGRQGLRIPGAMDRCGAAPERRVEDLSRSQRSQSDGQRDRYRDRQANQGVLWGLSLGGGTGARLAIRSLWRK
jgi:hypothetical protein